MVQLPTPILFLEEFKAIPGAVLQLLGFPSVSYSDTEPYSLNRVVTYLVGFNVFQGEWTRGKYALVCFFILWCFMLVILILGFVHRHVL